MKAYSLPPELLRKAENFSRAQYILYFAGFGWSVVVLLFILFAGIAPIYRGWAVRATRIRFLQAAIFVPLLLFTLAVLDFPVDACGHWISLSYGIFIQSWPSWTGDWGKMQVLIYVAAIFLVWILYAIIRRSPRRSWFYFWLAMLPLLVFVVFIAPVVIAPIFNQFEPLESKDPALVVALEKVVHRAGMNIPPQRMFWMNESGKGNDLNAYVTGISASKRVVVYDTTIQRMTVPETMFVFGHEMGHYVLNHIYKGMAFAAALLFVAFYCAYRGMLWMLSRWSARWKIHSADEWASLPALLLCLTVLAFLASPIANTFSRHLEHQADQYGLEVTHGLLPDSQQVAAQAFQVLGEMDLSDPHPGAFIRIWLYNHPPLSERLKYALSYDPWAEGQSPAFVKSGN